MVYIDGVRYGTDEHGCEVISRLRWTKEFDSLGTNYSTKDAFIDFIDNKNGKAKTKYQKNGVWCEGEDVRAVDGKYLSTDANNTKADNLGNLPKF